MNKEVIYLEPEDDITDILTKLQRAEQKLVALVPPKKATMLRSAVNMKLVARAAKECDKVAVIVTADPAIVKLAMAAQIPVAKTLQSRPVVPTPEMIKASEDSEQVIDEDLADANADKAELDSLKGKKANAKTPGEASKSASERRSDKSANTIDLTEEGLENGSKDGKTGSKKGVKGKDGKKVPNFDKYRKWIVLGVVAAVILVVVGVWAFVFAPAVKITVAMSTSSSNFSENVSFTGDQNAENLDEGKFYVERQVFEQKYNASFTATGEEDHGEKAKGSVTVSYTFVPKNTDAFAIEIDQGDVFTASNGLTYAATTGNTISWDGNSTGNICDGKAMNLNSNCTMSVTIPIEATRAGLDYNSDVAMRWNNFGNASVASSGAITGGTTNKVTVVSQSDVDKAKEEIIANHTIDGKDMLFSQLRRDADLVLIETSFKAEAGETKATPAVNEEVKDGVTPDLSVTAIYAVYTVTKPQLETFINHKTDLGADQKIYSIGDPYFEKFTNIDEPARLKTVVKTGPTVTEEDILEKSKGRKLGEVQSLLRSINGVSSVTIDPSYFWVWSVPNDDSKIEIELTVEDN